jgi:hypothetical protein
MLHDQSIRTHVSGMHMPLDALASMPPCAPAACGPQRSSSAHHHRYILRARMMKSSRIYMSSMHSAHKLLCEYEGARMSRCASFLSARIDCMRVDRCEKRRRISVCRCVCRASAYIQLMRCMLQIIDINCAVLKAQLPVAVEYRSPAGAACAPLRTRVHLAPIPPSSSSSVYALTMRHVPAASGPAASGGVSSCMSAAYIPRM